MVNAKVSRHNDEIVAIIISGHAGYSSEMMDVVCSEVSAISVGGLNSIDIMCPDSCSIEMRSGYVSINVIHNSSKLQVILNTIQIQLETVAQTNKKYVKVTKVEV